MADMRSWDETAAHYRALSKRHFITEASYTRPANTTQYTAGDQLAGTPGVALTFGTCAVNDGGGGVVKSAICIDSANQATKANLRLYLFSGSPTTGEDNANWAPTDADIAKAVGVFSFDTWEIGGTTAGTAGNAFAFGSVPVGAGPFAYRCDAASGNLFGLAIERGSFTPVASEQFTFRIAVEHD